MSKPIRFLIVLIDALDPSTHTFAGDANASGAVEVEKGVPTDVWVILSPNNPDNTVPPPVATVTALTWPDAQPSWVSSESTPLPAGQTNPAWVLEATSDTAGLSALFHFDIMVGGLAGSIDPTIVTVDGPPDVMVESAQQPAPAQRQEAPAGGASA